MNPDKQAASATVVAERSPDDATSAPSFRVLALINPKAGRYTPERLRELMLEGAAGTAAELVFVEMGPEERARDFTSRAALDNYQMVLVAGGDGTLAEAATGLLGTMIPLGVIPAGTGNIVATNLGVPLGIREATHAALLGTPRAYDVGRLDDGHIFLLAAGAGYDADLIRDADRELKRRFGPLAYILAIFMNLRKRHARFTVELDGWQRIRINAKTVLVCNVGRTMGSLPLAPDARTDDGWLDVVVFRFRNFLVFFLLFLKALFGGLKNDPRVQFFRARRVRIMASRPMPVQVDGDFIDRTTPIEITVLPGALMVLYPAARPALDLARLTEDALKTLQKVTGTGGGRSSVSLFALAACASETQGMSAAGANRVREVDAHRSPGGASASASINSHAGNPAISRYTPSARLDGLAADFDNMGPGSSRPGSSPHPRGEMRGNGAGKTRLELCPVRSVYLRNGGRHPGWLSRGLAEIFGSTVGVVIHAPHARIRALLS